MDENKHYWSQRYVDKSTGWDIGYPSTPIVEYVNQLTDKKIRILIPGAGNAYEAEYLWNNGFSSVYVLDVVPEVLDNFAQRNPTFPRNQLIECDFFQHEEMYDLIIEQTFFCSFLPTTENRSAYAKKMASLLEIGGKLVGLWFNIPLQKSNSSRPFGGSREEYMNYLQPYFSTLYMESCYNSIKPRQGSELFGIFTK